MKHLRQVFKSLDSKLSKVDDSLKTTENREKIVDFVYEILDKYSFPEDNSIEAVKKRFKKFYLRTPVHILNDMHNEAIAEIESETNG